MKSAINGILSMHLQSSQYIFGFADLTGLITEKYKPFNHAISIIRKLDEKTIETISDGPTEVYFQHYNAINDEMNIKLRFLGAELSKININSTAIKATVYDSELDDDFDTNLTYYFSHKMAATRAGLGWIGKTDLFISKQFGPRVRLATLLTDYKLVPEQSPVNSSQCGNCSLCVSSCPAAAANGKAWDISIHRDEFFNAQKCREYCQFISKQNLDREISLCGKCVYVCPIGRKNGGKA